MDRRWVNAAVDYKIVGGAFRAIAKHRLLAATVSSSLVENTFRRLSRLVELPIRRCELLRATCRASSARAAWRERAKRFKAPRRGRLLSQATPKAALGAGSRLGP